MPTSNSHTHIEFEGAMPIRMASDFMHVRKTIIISPFRLELGPGYQNLFAADDEKEIVYLVKWDTAGNQPSFNVVRVAMIGGRPSLTAAERIEGCCTAIEFKDNQVIVTAFRLDKDDNPIFVPITVTDFKLKF